MGNLTAIESDGRHTVNTYDNADHLVTRSYYTTGATDHEPSVTFSNDANGNLTGWSDGTVGATLVHGPNNRKTQEGVNYGTLSRKSWMLNRLRPERRLFPVWSGSSFLP